MNTLLDLPVPTQPTISHERTRRLLLVAYNFPPVGGAGVQRPVKWVKNLRKFGWDVTVLTTLNPSVPARDESLLADIPDDVVVARARTWEPDYQTKQGLVESAGRQQAGILTSIKSAAKGIMKRAVKLALQPDPQVLWVSNAIQTGRQILREFSHDAILVTAPAYSSFFVGTALKRQFGLPLILDFRDEWDMSGKYLENAQRDIVSQVIQSRMQRYVLRRADAIVATTKASTANLAEKLAQVDKKSTPAVTVYNGFDAEEFQTHAETDSTPAKVAATKGRKTFRLLYTGTLWNLTTIEPLVDAIAKLHQSAPDLVSRLELVCVGRKTPEQVSTLERLRATGCQLELVDYCEHAKVLDWLRTTDSVCLLLSDVPGAERVVPAKLFEYLANRKDMLAIVPTGETADIVQRFFPQGCFEPKNVDGIVDWLKSRLAGDGTAITTTGTADFEEYSRTTQTERLVELLDQVVGESNQSGRAAR